MLARAQQAQAAKDYALAAAAYRAFLDQYGSRPEAPAARLGLAVALLKGPGRDYDAAQSQLDRLVGLADFPDRPQALFYLGALHRGRAARSADRPAPARKELEEAARSFEAAAQAFDAQAVKKQAGASARADAARQARAEILVHLDRSAEARDLLAGLVHEQRRPDKPFRDRTLYEFGVASLLAKDLLGAGRAFSQLGPFEQPGFGTHARYLLGRACQLQDERPEAVNQFEAVVLTYEGPRARGIEALAQPPADPVEKARLEAVVKEPPAEPVARAALQLGVLYYEAGRFADARARFADFSAWRPTAPPATDARLYSAMAAVQLRQFAEAEAILTPLAQEDQAGSALLWLGRAQAGGADPDDPDAAAAALTRAAATLGRAVDPRLSLSAAGRGDCLLELAEVQEKRGRSPEAAALYTRLLDERLLPGRGEEILQRQATALNRAGNYAESDKACARFQQAYPRSLLLPEVRFRHAENAAFQARSAGDADSKLLDEAARTYREVIERYPEFAAVNLARLDLARIHYDRGEIAKAVEILDAIPVPEWSAELVGVPYLLADCLLRQTATATADDALAAGKLREELERAAQLLGDFAANQPDNPLVPDALLRLGLSRQRLGDLLSEPEERKQALAAARTAYERVLLDYPLNDVRPRAALERARCLALAGDPNEAVNRLRAFAVAPLAREPVAPLALLQWATLLRAQENKAGEAAEILARCRKRSESDLLKDPTRATWVPLLRFHHAAALEESGRPAEARALYAAVARDFPDHPLAGETVLRRGITLRDEGMRKMDQANQAMGAPNLQPAAQADAKKQLEEGRTAVRAAAKYLEEAAGKDADIGRRARLYYLAAWCYRGLGDEEADAARNALREERRARLQKAADQTAGAPSPPVPAQEVPLSAVPLQPAERKTRALYQAAIDAAPDLTTAHFARLELAEHHALRADHAAAVKLLKQALDHEPTAAITEQVRLRLGLALKGVGDEKAALAQFEAVAANLQGPLAAAAHFLAGDLLLRRGDAEAAARHLALFREHEPFKNLGPLTEAGVLRFGHALARQGKSEPGRQAMNKLLEHFPDSAWAGEARYALGHSWQAEKRLDEAIEVYKVAAANNNPAAARAWIQIGAILLKRQQVAEALEAFRNAAAGDPTLAGLALADAAYAHTLLGHAEEAASLWKQVQHDHPQSAWAGLAKERLAAAQAGEPPHLLPAAVRLLAPDVADAWTPDPLGQLQEDSVRLTDPTVAASHAFTLARVPPARTVPAPWLRLALPEPFEHRLPPPPKAWPADGPLPLTEDLPALPD
jgi:TolA-binding protein